MCELVRPTAPVKIAVIGAGWRSSNIYGPIWPTVADWLEVVAVCDPVCEHADKLASELGVRAYYDIGTLVKDGVAEAAMIITPIESHHSLTVFLASHGIHCHTETTWCSMICQARDMIAAARKHDVIVRVAENFFRFPSDRFAQTLRDDGYLGAIERIFSYDSHTGYHNNSRWLVFSQSHSLWVQAFEHRISHPGYYSTPERFHEEETYHGRYYQFPNNLLVIDQSANHKSWLGRCPRPGYEEWQGQRGTFVTRPSKLHQWSEGEMWLRRCSDEVLGAAQESRQTLNGGGWVDEITRVEMLVEDGLWSSCRANCPERLIEYRNPIRTVSFKDKHVNDWYGIPIAGHLIDFALAVRGLRPSEFSDEDALMSLMMEIGARESVLNSSSRVALPLEGDIEADALERESQKKRFGVDPLDIEAMLEISFPRP